MSDLIGLAVIILVLACGLFGLSYLGKSPEQITNEEFEKRVKEGRGTMTAGAFAGMQALQKLLNPKAAEAVEVEKDLKAGYYADQQETGAGDAGRDDASRPIKTNPTREEGDA